MATLAKATLQEIKADRTGTPVGAPIPVQFNPNSLKLTLSSQAEGGKSRGRQTKQYLGKSSTLLAFDLVFDTADEGTDDKPRSVREKTAMVERFVLPKGEGKQKQAPPRVRFHWGTLIIDGVIESVAIDFDLFSASGAPLRAKVGVQIKEQDAKYEFLKSGSGANEGGDAPPAGSPAAGQQAMPGGSGGGPTDRTGTALGGESAADFAQRMGLDPAAWRGIAGGLANPLSLDAGLSIDFDASLSLSAGIGVSAGFGVEASVSLEGSLGLGGASSAAGAGPAAGASAGVAPRDAGLAIAAAGGVGAAIAQVKTASAGAAAASTRSAFGTPAPSAAASGAGAPNAPAEDVRATSYGFGVPLRPRVGGAADVRNGALRGGVALRPYARHDDVLRSRDPSAAPWVELPAIAARPAAPARSASTGGCGCGCGGSHGRGTARGAARNAGRSAPSGGCGCGGAGR